jgi:hypothetical protein
MHALKAWIDRWLSRPGDLNAMLKLGTTFFLGHPVIGVRIGGGPWPPRLHKQSFQCIQYAHFNDCTNRR